MISGGEVLTPISLHANKKGSRPTKPARASQRRRSRAAYRPIASTRACSALLGRYSDRDSTRVTHHRGGHLAGDADVELRKTQDEPNAQTYGPRRRKIGGGLLSHKPVRRILHACPPKKEKHDTSRKPAAYHGRRATGGK